MASSHDIPGRRKAAILLISMGTELSALVFQHLEQDEIEALTLDIVRVGRVDADVRESILSEFGQMHMASHFISAGGVEYAEDLLEKALGERKGREVLDRVLGMMRTSPLDSIRKALPEQLLGFVENEHPQTIALILSHLPAENAAIILAGLPQEVQVDVASRIAVMEGTTPEVLHDVGAVLERKVASFGSKGISDTGGIKPLVDILNSVDRSTERAILERLDGENPELAEAVRQSMFVFEDIAALDEKSLQLIMREIDTKDLALALKVSTDDIKGKFFKCMSERASGMLKEDMGFLGAVRLRSVEEAQQKIVAQVRRLEESGVIQLSRGGTQGEEYVT